MASAPASSRLSASASSPTTPTASATSRPPTGDPTATAGSATSPTAAMRRPCAVAVAPACMDVPAARTTSPTVTAVSRTTRWLLTVSTAATVETANNPIDDQPAAVAAGDHERDRTGTHSSRTTATLATNSAVTARSTPTAAPLAATWTP